MKQNNMKLQLIMLDNPIVVSDETPKEYEPSYSKKMNRIDTGVMSNLAWKDAYPKDLLKLLASSNFIFTATNKKIELPSIDFSDLSEDDCKKIGWVNVVELAEKYIENRERKTSKEHDLLIGLGYLEGFKAAQSINEKKFGEEDLTLLMQKIENGEKSNWCKVNSEKYGSYQNAEHIWLKNFIESLSQPKVFNIEVEMEEYDHYDSSSAMCYSPTTFKLKPKITNNSIKITKIL